MGLKRDDSTGTQTKVRLAVKMAQGSVGYTDGFSFRDLKDWKNERDKEKERVLPPLQMPAAARAGAGQNQRSGSQSE